MKHDALNKRMKENYEYVSKTRLMRRIPVIIRLDGKAFHTFTKHFQKPYDEIFHKAMNNTLKYLCANIQCCKFGYTQSDEISLLLTDFDTITTDAWFNYEVQKMCSIAASMATLAFNRYFRDAINEETSGKQITEYYKQLFIARDQGAMFDARCFNIPEDEVANYFVARQTDATRNAIQMLGQTYFSHSELNKKKSSDIQEMLYSQKNINFNDMPIPFKRGVACRKMHVDCPERACGYKTQWTLDYQIPLFSHCNFYITNEIPRLVEFRG